MYDDGIAKFYEDIGIENIETDLVVLLISMYMKASVMGEYKWSEFLQGSKTLKADNVDSWKYVLK